jgi:hypothetical protein
VKKKLWGGEFWTKGFYVSTVVRHGDENTIQEYVKKQDTEKDYKSIHHQQLGACRIYVLNSFFQGGIDIFKFLSCAQKYCIKSKMQIRKKLTLILMIEACDRNNKFTVSNRLVLWFICAL